MLRKFLSPEILYGPGARERLPDYLRNFHANRILLVSDGGLARAGWTSEVEDLLRRAAREYVVFDAVSPNPRESEAAEGADIYRREACDMIVALGGGSPMDCAKGIGILAANPGAIRDFEGVDRVEAPLPPTIFLPTTSGTAADLSQFAIITNEERNYKMAIISKAIVPDVSIVDPELTVTMDAALTAATGMDVLTHAVEAASSLGRGAVTDLHAYEAITLVRKWLHAAVEDPNDIEARKAMAQASTFAGLAFSNASLGAVHAMAHSLGGLLDYPHGECNARLLETVVAWNFPADPPVFRRIAAAFGVDGAEDAADADLIARLRYAIRTLAESVGISGGLAAMGLDEESCEPLAAIAVNDPCLLTNPRPAEAEDLAQLFRNAM